MKKRSGIILFALLALSVGLLWVFLAPEPLQEGRCRLARKKADPDSPLLWLTSQYIRPLEDKPESAKDAPAGFAHPRYYSVRSGERSILMATDYSERNVRLCIDTDGDGILSEERCLTARVSDKTLVSGRRSTGFYSVVWDASRYSNGLYFYKLLAGEYTSIKKMVLMK